MDVKSIDGHGIRGLKALGLAGCNMTIPNKVDAMQYMNWGDPLALRIFALQPCLHRCGALLVRALDRLLRREAPACEALANASRL